MGGILPGNSGIYDIYWVFSIATPTIWNVLPLVIDQL